MALNGYFTLVENPGLLPILSIFLYSPSERSLGGNGRRLINSYRHVPSENISACREGMYARVQRYSRSLINQNRISVPFHSILLLLVVNVCDKNTAIICKLHWSTAKKRLSTWLAVCRVKQYILSRETKQNGTQWILCLPVADVK